MDIYSLRLFLSAAKTLNFTKTAENFYTTQPAVSRRIRELEKELGYPLFLREYHGVSLTKEGELLLPFIQKSMDALNLGLTTVNNLVNIKKRTITIVSITPMTGTFLPGIIDEFTQENPDVEFEIIRMFSRQIRESIAQGNRFDIYIGEESDINVDDSWEKTVIKSDPLGLFVRKREELDCAARLKEFLRKHRAFLLPEEEAWAMTSLSRKLLASYGVDPSYWVETSPSESIMFHIASGMGYALFPKNEFFLKAFDLKYIPLDTDERLNMIIACRKGAPSRVQAFSRLVARRVAGKG